MQNNFLSSLLYDKTSPVIFTSGFFLIGFTVFMLFYAFFYNKKILRNIYIITFSLYFYYKTSGEYLTVLIASIVLNYIFGLLLSNVDQKGLRRFSFIFSILVNISILSFFKYTNYIIDNLNLILSGNIAKAEIFLPAGISFFTFQSISYLTDIFRKNLSPSENFLDFAFFVSFFPYVLAGPITRGKEMLKQINENTVIDKRDIAEGFSLVCRGLIKKGILSGLISQYCNLIYDAPGNFSGFENFVAMISFSLEIYFDFSGYSDIAIGIARLMGFRLKDNFNSPYKAKNIIDFWNRWHISLSTWLRDYIFLPVNYYCVRHIRQKGAYLLYAYIAATGVTMLIAGIWHGASNKYVIWGCIHGFALITNRTYLYIVKKKIQKCFFMKFAGKILTLSFIAASWVIFRSNNLDEALLSFRLILFDFDINYLAPFYGARPLLSIFLILALLFIYLPNLIKIKITNSFQLSPLYIKAAVFILILQIIIQIQTESVQPFIYFQF